VLLGEHDFSAFAASRDSNLSKTRRVVSSCFYPFGSAIVYQIAADAFLWKMVRSIVGTMLELSAAGGDSRAMEHILASGNRALAGQTAPARGLFLEKVMYGRETSCSE
jgi:tRNA pseudouridine38-40 synthase